MITDRVDLHATQTAREEEMRIALHGFKPRVDTESLMEMRRRYKSKGYPDQGGYQGIKAEKPLCSFQNIGNQNIILNYT